MAMPRLLVALIVACLCASRVAGGPDTRDDGPVLLAKGQGYTIHLFDGAVQGNPRVDRVVQAGKVLLHTRTDSGQGTWLIRTGAYAIPTVRPSFSVSRLLGVLQTETQIIVVYYYCGRIFDSLPEVLPSDKGGYRVRAFEKESAKRILEAELDPANGRLEHVPEETTDLGIIKKTDDGFTVLGTSFSFLPDGTIRQQIAP